MDNPLNQPPRWLVPLILTFIIAVTLAGILGIITYIIVTNLPATPPPSDPNTKIDVFADQITFSPDGKSLAAAKSGEIGVWSIPELKLIHSIGQNRSSRTLIAWSPDSQYLATDGDGGVITVWKVQDGSLYNKLSGRSPYLESLVFSPDGTLLASAGSDSYIHLWQAKDGSYLKGLKAGEGGVNSISFSNDSKTLASVSGGTLSIWQLDTFTNIKKFQLKNYSSYSVAFSPNNALIAVGGGDGKIGLWDIANNKLVREFKGSIFPVSFVNFSSDGQFITGSIWNHDSEDYFITDKTIRIWSVKSGELVKSLNGHEKWIWCATFSPDGKYLASSARDGTIRLWPLS